MDTETIIHHQRKASFAATFGRWDLDALLFPRANDALGHRRKDKALACQAVAAEQAATARRLMGLE